MVITKTAKRKVNAWRDGDSVVIQEQESLAWVAAKGNRKWTDDRVAVSLEELRKIVQGVEEEKL